MDQPDAMVHGDGATTGQWKSGHILCNAHAVCGGPLSPCNDASKVSMLGAVTRRSNPTMQERSRGLSGQLVKSSGHSNNGHFSELESVT